LYCNHILLVQRGVWQRLILCPAVMCQNYWTLEMCVCVCVCACIYTHICILDHHCNTKLFHILQMYAQSNKNPSAWYFIRPTQAVTCSTVAIIIRVVLLSAYLCFCGVSLSSIHYNQSHRVYINRRQQYICFIWS